MQRRTIFNIFFLGATLSLATGVQAQATIVVGGKAFTEQILMTEMTVQLLQSKGFKPDRKAGMGTAVLRAAQENGQIDWTMLRLTQGRYQKRIKRKAHIAVNNLSTLWIRRPR